MVRIESPTVYLDWGTASGVKTGDQFRIFREGMPLKHPKTGEVLGKAEETLAEGAVQDVKEKFSVGRLYQVSELPKAGDRTRWIDASMSTTPEATPVAGAAVPPAPESKPAPLKEVWRSEPIKRMAASVTPVDLEGNGTKMLAVAFRDRIEVFRWNGQALEAVANFENRHYKHWLTIEAAKVRPEGGEDLFATVFMDMSQRPRTVVFRWDGKALQKVDEFEGFVRSIDKADGSRVLVWQNLSRNRDVRFTPPAVITYEKEKVRPGPALAIRPLNDDQLFGFTFGDWDNDKNEDLALLQQGEKLRLFLSDMKWSSREVFGGTKNIFAYGDESSGTVSPRLTYRPVATGKSLLLVPHNFSELGVRLTHLKIYKRSELHGLLWNGLEMTPAWTQPLVGYLADYAVADLTKQGSAQLWTALVSSGDKTVLVAYQLP